MGIFSFLGKVYDLDTLDTRFTSSSSVPYKTVIEGRADPIAQREATAKAQSRASPSKWNTPEFYLYYVVFIIAVPYMFWVPYSVSRRTSHGAIRPCPLLGVKANLPARSLRSEISQV